MTHDDVPLDPAAVAADDAALDAVRSAAGDDPALRLLRELVLDVEQDLPAAVPARVPVGRGTTVVSLAAVEERRLARGGTVLAVLTAGVLSLGGVAAASTLAPVDSPLHGVGQAVRSAAGAVVGAVTPPKSPARSAVALPSASASASPSASARPTALPSRPAAAPRTPAPGATTSALARSEAAARQVDQLLVAAQDLLRDGRTAAATGRLDLAQRRLADVLPVHRADLPSRLAALRERAATPPSPRANAPKPSRTEEPREAEPAEPRGSSRTAPPKGKSSGKGAARATPPQPSASDASVKPRA